jgi:hypothetical protein
VSNNLLKRCHWIRLHISLSVTCGTFLYLASTKYLFTWHLLQISTLVPGGVPITFTWNLWYISLPITCYTYQACPMWHNSTPVTRYFLLTWHLKKMPLPGSCGIFISMHISLYLTPVQYLYAFHPQRISILYLCTYSMNSSTAPGT